jgi:hypothetical protein
MANGIKHMVIISVLVTSLTIFLQLDQPVQAGNIIKSIAANNSSIMGNVTGNNTDVGNMTADGNTTGLMLKIGKK